MTSSAAFICGGPSAGRIITVHCDAETCSAAIAYSTREEYVAAGLAGWRRTTEPGPDSRHACPAHSGALVPS